MFRRVLTWLEGFRHGQEAYIDLLKQPFQPAGGLCPPDPPKKFEVLFFIFRKMGFWVFGMVMFHNLRKRMVPWFRARKMLQDGGLLLFIACLWTHFVKVSVFNSGGYPPPWWGGYTSRIKNGNLHEMGLQRSYRQKKTTIQPHFSRPESWYHSFPQIMQSYHPNDTKNPFFKKRVFESLAWLCFII